MTDEDLAKVRKVVETATGSAALLRPEALKLLAEIARLKDEGESAAVYHHDHGADEGHDAAHDEFEETIEKLEKKVKLRGRKILRLTKAFRTARAAYSRLHKVGPAGCSADHPCLGCRTMLASNRLAYPKLYSAAGEWVCPSCGQEDTKIEKDGSTWCKSCGYGKGGA